MTAALILIAIPTAATAAPPDSGVRVDLRVLVVSQGDSTTDAIAGQLAAEGVPFDFLDLLDPNRPVIDAAFLSDEVDGSPRARYQAVVLPSAAPFGSTAEATALADYERRFDIAQVDAFVWPSSTVGLGPPTYSGTLDGVTAQTTDAARADAFGYLRGAVPFEDIDPASWESYGYLSQPLAPDPTTGTRFEPLLVAPGPAGTGEAGVLVGEYISGGRRELVITFAYNIFQQQFRSLAHGIVDWMTGGAYLGHYRNYFSVHVDDVLMPDARWSVEGNCTPGDDCTGPHTTADIRMAAADADFAAEWQSSRDFPLDLLFNAAGSVEAVEETGQPDPLTDRLVALRSGFRWTNHTYGHPYLGCVQDFTTRPWRCETDPVTGAVRYAPQAQITAEISANLVWATANGLTVDPTAVVTGEHSGLRILPQQPVDNPELAAALSAAGVAWLGADNSRDPRQRPVGPALTVPRHPMNVFYNVATAAEEVDEYNWIYTSRADGGSGLCEDNPATMTCLPPLDPQTGYGAAIVPAETRIALSHVLSNDPRPHFVHQSNLAEERIVYPLLDAVLSSYRDTFTAGTPVVSQPLAANGFALKRQAAWRAAGPSVTAYVRDGMLTVVAPAGVEVPVTVPDGTRRDDTSGPLFGSPYAGRHSAFAASDGSPIRLVLP